MVLGAPELLIVLVILAMSAALLALPIYAAVAMLVPMGFILAIVYLAQRSSRVQN